MPLTEHLRELRSRLIKSIVAFFIGTGIAFYFASQIFEILKEPVKRSYPQVELITLSPTEPLFILLKISIVFGFILSSPFILFQLWRFVEPALYPNEKKTCPSTYPCIHTFIPSWRSFLLLCSPAYGFEVFARHRSFSTSGYPLSFCEPVYILSSQDDNRLWHSL